LTDASTAWVGELIHHLDRARDDTRADDRGDRIRSVVHRGERRHQRAFVLGERCELHRDLGHDAERAFGPDERADQVVAVMVDRLAADPDDRPVGEHELEPGDVVGRDAVRERVRAARVLGDVASEGAGLLARRVGHEVQPVGRGGGRQMKVHEAGLDDGAEVRYVDLDDP